MTNAGSMEKTMKAKVRDDSRVKTVTACAGVQFIKEKWFDVPIDREDEARRNPFLIIDEDDKPKPKSVKKAKSPRRKTTKEPIPGGVSGVDDVPESPSVELAATSEILPPNDAPVSDVPPPPPPNAPPVEKTPRRSTTRKKKT